MRAPPNRGATLATAKEMSDFLASVERRAFKQAVFAVHEEQSALDIVQDAMLRLAEKYPDRPAPELPLLGALPGLGAPAAGGAQATPQQSGQQPGKKQDDEEE